MSNGVPPQAGSGSRASHEAAKASSPEASIPNAYALARLLRALSNDCESTDGWEGAVDDLRASADLLEQFAITVRHVYAEKLPDTWFVCGASTITDSSGLPDRIHVCPAYGATWSVMYERRSASGMEARQGRDVKQARSHCDDSPTPKGRRP